MCHTLEGYDHFRIGVHFRLTSLEVRGHDAVIYLSQTPIFDWCVVEARCKNRTQQDCMCLRRDWTTRSTNINHSRLSSQHKWEDLGTSIQRISTHALSITITESKEV